MTRPGGEGWALETERPLDIRKSTRIYDLLRAYPHLRQVFSKYAIACPFCAGSLRDTVAIGAWKHKVDADLLVRELRRAAGLPPLPGEDEAPTAEEHPV
jgi:hypothetical protein